MDDLINEFLAETNESLDELDLDLVSLEQTPNDHDLLSKIFRIIHTIKGTCSFLSLPRLEKVAHHVENVLERFRDGDLEITPDYMTLLFESIDQIRLIVRGIEETGAEPSGDDRALIEKLDALEAAFDTGDGPTQPQNNDTPIAKAADKPVSAQSLRVSVDVLENLMTIVNEMVLTRNQLLQILRENGDSVFSAPLQRLNYVVSELQESMMKTQMQPIGDAWSKLPRIIRDLAIKVNKKIELEMTSQDTELDRQVLDLIKDPLMHMVRNSVDHGIETPETRKAAGKPETGKILLNAFHEGEHIIIQISDDGKGLALNKIKAKVLENGLANVEELEEMSPSQINQFIFHPGFSTAEKVTSVSGRGVGMDVVRTNIEKIGGSVDLHSVEGQGSTFTIKIPLALAIIDGKTTDIFDARYFFKADGEDAFKNHDKAPVHSTGEAEKTEGRDQAKKRVLLVDDSPFFRNMLTPLLSVAGYDVVSLESPYDALKMCNKGAKFDVIISDIEMPDMDGFEFAEKIKTETSWKDTPMLALSSHATAQDIDRGMRIGFSKCIAKFDRDTLLNTLSQTLAEQQQNSDPMKQGDVA